MTPIDEFLIRFAVAVFLITVACVGWSIVYYLKLIQNRLYIIGLLIAMQMDEKAKEKPRNDEA